MLNPIEKVVADVNSLPTTHELKAEWRVWQGEFNSLERECLRKKIAVLEITIRAARKQVAEYHDKASEYGCLAWNSDSPYYKCREMNLANVAFETVEARLQDEVDMMKKELASLKRKLKKISNK